MLINEFGEVGLDHHLLDRIDETMVLLPSGCLCCTIRGELSAAIRDLHGRARARRRCRRFRRLAVESTGLADPFPILSTVQADPVLRHHFRWGNIVTTVDAVNGLGQLARQARMRQAGRRRRSPRADQDRPRYRRGGRCPRRASAGAQSRRRHCSAAAERAIDADALLAHDLFATATRGEAARRWFTVEPGEGSHMAPASMPLRSSLDDAVDWTRFGLWLTMLLNRHGDKLLRVKGMLNVEGSATPVAIHGVQHLVHPPVHMAARPDDERSSRLVFIVDGLDRAAIEGSLRTFLRSE